MKQFLISLLLGGSLAFGAAKIRNSDVATNASIVYTKLNLVGGVTNNDLAGSIAFNKHVALGLNSTVYTNGAGYLANGNQTGTGSVYVMQDSPGLVTPILGVASATSVRGATGTATNPSFWIDTGGGKAGFYFGAGGLSFAYNTGDVYSFTSTLFRTNVVMQYFVTTSPTIPFFYALTESTTGFYRIGANNWGFTASGSKILDIGSSGLGVTGTLGMNNNRITSVGDPSSASDAATKNYVDNRVVTGSTLQAISASNIDWSQGNVFWKNLSANTTFTFSGKSSGQTIIVKVRNPANYTVTFPATLGGETVMWTGSTPPVATTGNKISTYTVFYDGTNNELIGSFLGNF